MKNVALLHDNEIDSTMRSDKVKEVMNQINDRSAATDAVFDIVDLYRYEGQEVQIIRQGDVVWFKAKDVATVLGYVQSDHAIKRHVRAKYKITLTNLYTRPLVSAGLVVRDKCGRITKNDNQDHTIYINEHGVYSLVMKSKLSGAEKFQDWVIEEVLPSIRRAGCFEDTDRVRQLEEQLDIKENELKTQAIELKTTKKELITQVKAHETYKANVRNLVINAQEIKRDGYIYIVANRAMEQEHKYKVGRTTTTLRKRLAGYNTGATDSARFYYKTYFRVHNCLQVENLITSKLSAFRENSDREVYGLAYKSLERVIRRICKSDNTNNDDINKDVISQADELMSQRPPIRPNPINLDMVDMVELMYSKWDGEGDVMLNLSDAEC